MLAIIKQYVRRMLMGKGKGILQIPPQKAVDDFANDLLKKFKKNGVPDEAITNPRDVKIIWEQITNREAAIFANNLKDVLKKPDPFKKAGEVVDLTGKKIDTSKPILGGKNVPETEAQIKTKLEGMNEKTVDRIRRRRYEAARKAEREKMAKDPDYLPKIIDPEDFAGGGRASSGLNYLLGEDDQNSRVPYGAGGMGRRLFLKLMGGAAAGTVAAKSGLFSLLKAGKPTAQVLTSVPINNIDGMPVWFKPLVNKVIKEGDDVTKKFATVDREIVHKTKLPDSKTDVLVTQDLNTGNVSVDIGLTKHGFKEGHLGQPVRLEYKAGEVLEGPIKKGKPTKTKEEFWVDEAEFTGGHPENIKFEETVSEKFGQHGSNFDEVEKFATGKVKKKKPLKKAEKTEFEQGRAENEYDLQKQEGYFDEAEKDFYEKASGGRVPFAGGGGIMKLLQKLLKKKPNTLKEFIEKRKFLKNMVGNTEKNKKARELKMLKDAADEARRNPGFKFKHIDIDKEIRPIFDQSKDRTIHASGGLAGMLGE